ncbi:methyltransferase [Phenylobacterium hankyongense]|uniref:Methyltransferase n=1 Tax=Phenylobacterium hankyongense TaxID=1813876 RepID=A0A328AXY6_9CAUL|nr:FkbM family methyltransferase [Phenylobacterium hankyongense]RAK59960.1 methyltransferase [Phenylobacterium hankyongense]
MRTMTLAEGLEMLVALRDQTSAPSKDEQMAFINFCLVNLTRSKSQFLQDLWVAYELKSRKNGFFVEFGGADGIKFSNSYFLETELGWNGVVAEPARVWHPAIRNNRACFVDNRCVWTQSGQSLTFNQPPIAAHSTIDSYSDSDVHADTRKDGQRYEVETISLNDLLQFWGAPRRIDYLSIDTEGSELDILQAFDFATYDVRLITVEHNHSDKRQPLFELLTSKGFRRKFEKLSGVDDWYVKTY